MPSVSAGGPYSVLEGGSTTLTASGSSPASGPLSYAWDLNHDGMYETPGQSVTFSARLLDGPSSVPVAVLVTDSAGQQAVAETTIAVQPSTWTAPAPVLPSYGVSDPAHPSPSGVAIFGNSVGPAGDVNGDGYADLIVGAPNYTNRYQSEERLYLYLGSASG